MQIRAWAALAAAAAVFATTSHAEFVRCTSKDGRSSVIRRDKCDSPDDVRTPVEVKSPIRPDRASPPAPASPPPAATAPAGLTPEFIAAVKANDYAGIRKHGEPLARQGNATAMLLLGDIHKNARGVPKDEAAAYYWTRKAADQGDARGQTGVAAMMQAGSGTPRDDAGAVAWLQKAAQQGYVLGQAALGSAYLNGQGVPKDEEKAVFWLRKAAAQGDDYSNRMLKKLGRTTG